MLRQDMLTHRRQTRQYPNAGCWFILPMKEWLARRDRMLSPYGDQFGDEAL